MSVYCRAKLNYLDGLSTIPVEVEIADGRGAAPASWSERGFELVRHESAVDDWLSVEKDWLHYEEIGALTRAQTGCDAVIYYPALIRNPESAARFEDLNPVQFVHSDYTEAYRGMIEDTSHPYHAILAPYLERAGLDAEALRSARRVVTLQFWRNIGPARMDHPLAFCDARSVTRDQLHPLLVAEYGGVPTQFHSFGVSAPKADAPHRWVTFPEMERDEVVVFRAYDSERAEAGQPFWTPHSAFIDPVAGPDAPTRESIEMRAICLFN